MLGIDGQKIQQWKEKDKRSKALERKLEVLANDLKSNTVTVEDDAGRDVSILAAQMGKPMFADDVIKKLKICNPNLIFIRALPNYPNLYGIYVSTQQRSPSGGWEKIQKHICGMEAGIMPEFSVLHKRKIRVPNKELFGLHKPTDAVDWTEIETFADETRGWRTVLIRLLHQGLITMFDVQKHFGWSPSKDSEKWQKQTQ